MTAAELFLKVLRITLRNGESFLAVSTTRDIILSHYADEQRNENIVKIEEIPDQVRYVYAWPPH